jgi:hypothetical protein
MHVNASYVPCLYVPFEVYPYDKNWVVGGSQLKWNGLKVSIDTIWSYRLLLGLLPGS